MANAATEEVIWLPPHVAARKIGRHPRTLARWADAGKIEFDKSVTSGRRAYREDEIVRLGRKRRGAA